MKLNLMSVGVVPSLVGALVLFLPEIVYAAESKSEPHWLITLFVNLFPILILIGIWLLFMRRWGGVSHKEYMERARLHMDRLETSNQRQETLLSEIVTLLKKD